MEPWEIVLKGNKKFRRLLQKEAEKFGLSYTEVQVLYFLKNGEKNVTSLANFADVNKSTMVEVLDKLEKKGFIIRERDTQDRRVVIVKITDAGLKILEDVRGKYKELIVSLLSKIKDPSCVVEFFEILINEAEKDETI
ncbi:MarR family winged helix-turn-helix transcriptional regulator [Sulfurisphaera ohwakuensis]|uniref:HTH-type transcriptional regulator MgrA n=1 Tax=Sulfurisphaera ohwakuensis TaxID=69656 RepID=A0A650CK05_SULOH|nr:MarR family transcriptional regulator [Sulfurisphaera ohwakuensis]MBB5255020.1 DNA-binding MarR family transcriptional regulator [Sulfurisphaera ohwakuensis]QGR18015.1 MarR family transcriptional regulator [Sulfurisphaera ohwakuensis]